MGDDHSTDSTSYFTDPGTGISPAVVEVSSSNKATDVSSTARTRPRERVCKALKQLEFSAPGPQMKVPPPQKKRLRAKPDDFVSKDGVCDCTVLECPGCFFPCAKCKSLKCGSVCRVNRNWIYFSITKVDKSS